MNLRIPLRTLAMGSMLALAVVSLPATQAFAKPKHPPDDGTRCFFQNADGSYEFYMPGEIVERGGLHYVCTADGSWATYKSTSGSVTLPGALPKSGAVAP